MRVHGEAAAAWVARLPDLLARCTVAWGVGPLTPRVAAGPSLVAFATRASGEPVVVKAAFPDAALRSEIDALAAYAGRGAVRLLNADPDGGIVLLERLEPGEPLTAVDDDDRATRVGARLMERLWRPPPQGLAFPAVLDWAETFERSPAGGAPLPPGLVVAAARTFRELAASAAPAVLLHGDLHHDNILSAEREPWLAIDPKGVVGEPCFEAGAFLRNPLPRVLASSDPGDLLRRRVDLLSQHLGLDRSRLAAWGFAQAVLAACWSLEDGDPGWTDWVRCAEWLRAIG